MKRYFVIPKSTIELVFVLMLLDTPFIIGGAVYWFLYNKNFLASSIETKGTVIKIISLEGSTGRSKTQFHPVVEFTDNFNNRRTFRSWVDSTSSGYKVGDIVKVAYGPSGEIICDFHSLWFGPLLFFLLGGGQLIVLIIGFVFRKSIYHLLGSVPAT
jgi:hypothetical protein